jgi:hypothetical protein
MVLCVSVHSSVFVFKTPEHSVYENTKQYYVVKCRHKLRTLICVF